MYRRAKQTWAKHLDFALWDIVVLALAYYVACVLRFDMRGVEYDKILIFRLALILIFIYFCTAMLGRAYKNIIHRNRYQELGAVILQMIFAYAVFAIYLYLTQEAQSFSRLVYAWSACISFIFIYGERIIWKRILRVRRLNDKKLPQLILIVETNTLENSVRGVLKKRYNDYFVAGIIIMDCNMKGNTYKGIPIVANKDDYKSFITTEVIDRVVIDIQDRKSTIELAEYLLDAGISVHIALWGNGLKLPNKTIEKLGTYMVLTASNSVADAWQLVCKRGLDIIGSIVGLTITGVLFLFLAPQIKKADPGPVFFAQERIGQNGRKFKLYKFRSMYVDAEKRKQEILDKNEMNGPMFKIKEDPRILPGIGKIMRNYSLDEFPQFWNVLKGDMSLVGTRPPTKKEFEKYDSHQKGRLSFKPGITGLWQISGRSKITNFEEIVQLDNKYIRSWNLRLDIKILLKTIKVVFNRDGAM